MAATVRPAKLRETLNAKLESATLKLAEIREADQPESNRYWEPGNIVTDFLHATRGVYPVLETFAKGTSLKVPGFEKWRDRWEGQLTASDLKLWRQMRAERVSQEHGEGAELIRDMIPITRGHNTQQPANVLLLGLAAQGYKNEVSKGGVRFAAYPTRPVSDVCADYLELSNRFVNDFVRDHANLIP